MGWRVLLFFSASLRQPILFAAALKPKATAAATVVAAAATVAAATVVAVATVEAVAVATVGAAALAARALVRARPVLQRLVRAAAVLSVVPRRVPLRRA